MAITRAGVRALALAAGIAVAAAVGGAAAERMFAMPSDAPVDRLVRNITAYTNDHPTSGHAYYLLGRVHAVAFSTKSRTVGVYRGGEKPGELPQLADNRWSDRTGPAPTVQELYGHLAASVSAYERAVDLCSPKAVSEWRETDLVLAWLGYASVLDAGLEASDQVDVAPQPPREVPKDGKPTAENGGKKDAPKGGEPPKPEPTPEARARFAPLIKDLSSPTASVREAAVKALEADLGAAAPVLAAERKQESKEAKEAVRKLLRAWWRDVAIEYYRRVSEATVDRDAKLDQQPIRGIEELASYEATAALVRLLKERGERRSEDKTLLAKAEEGLKRLRAVPPSMAMTPIIFGDGAGAGATRVGELLEPGSAAAFDMRGIGKREWWSWVKPTTAFLVWNPQDRRRIVSARQLFGSVTWWMMFRDGYEALTMLDDDRDGVLRAGELAGLAVWVDADGDGVCQRHEVRTVKEAGIAWIAAGIERWDGVTPMNSRGIGMTDGRVLATFDWMADPLPDTSAADEPPAGRAP
jgi:hypothetical protein